MVQASNAGAARLLAAAAELNGRLFLNCLDSVTDADAVRRPNEHSNSLAFIACHALDARHWLGRFLGLVLTNPLTELLGNVQSIDDVVSLPPLAEIGRDWLRVSTEVQACLAGLSASELGEPSPQRFPIADATFGGAVQFQLQHETCHIGQLALLRKYWGYPAMSWR